MNNNPGNLERDTEDFLARIGHSPAAAPGFPDPAAGDQQAIGDLLNQSNAAAQAGELATASSFASRAAYLSIAYGLSYLTGQAVLLLARIALAERRDAVALDGLVLAAGIIAGEIGTPGEVIVAPLMPDLASAAESVTLAGDQGARMRAFLVPIRQFLGEKGNVAGLIWTDLILAQAATEGGDVTAGEQYLRLALDRQTGSGARAQAGPPGDLPLPGPDLLVSAITVVVTALLSAKEDERAEAWAERATTLDAGSWKAWSALATVQQKMARWEQALRSLERVTAIRPDHPAAYASEAAILRALGRLPEAIEQATMAIGRGSDPAFFLLRGQLRHEADDHTAAIEDVEHAVSLAPDDIGVRTTALGLKVWSLVGLGEPQAALEAISAASTAQPPGSPAAAICAMLTSEVLTSMGRLDQAIEQCTRWIELVPYDADAWLHRADARLKFGDEAGAIADLREAAFMARDPDGALQRIEPLVAAKPDDPVLLGLRGFALSEGGHQARAMADLDRAVALDPDNAEIRMRRGLARLRCDFDLADLSSQPFTAEMIMASVDDLAASAGALGGEALTAYVWLVDRITADGWFRFRLTQREDPGAITVVLPGTAKPVQAWLRAGALTAARRWEETVQQLTIAQNGLAEQGFVCFASRIDLDLADCHIRLGQVQQARFLLDRWEDRGLALHVSPWTPNLRQEQAKIYNTSLKESGKRAITPELEYLLLYGVGLPTITRTHDLLDALLTSRLGDPDGALDKLGPPDKVKELASLAPNSLFDVATILRDGGRKEEALAMVDEAMAGSGIVPEQRTRAENLRGNLLLLLDRPAEAEQAFQAVAAASRRDGDRYGAILAQCNIASSLFWQGHLQRALEAVDSVRDDLPSVPSHAQQRWHQARAQILLGLSRPDDAEAAVLEAVKISETILSSLRTADLQTAWQGGSRDLYDFAVDIAMAAGHVGTALELVERARSRAFLFQLASRAPVTPAQVVAPEPGGQTDAALASAALARRRRVLARLLAPARQGQRADPETLSELRQISLKAEDITDTAELAAGEQALGGQGAQGAPGHGCEPGTAAAAGTRW